MSELTDLTIAGALSGLDKGEFTSRELTQAYIAEVENGRALNAFTTETPDKALEMADAADAALLRKSGLCATITQTVMREARDRVRTSRSRRRRTPCRQEEGR